MLLPKNQINTKKTQNQINTKKTQNQTKKTTFFVKNIYITITYQAL